jgi:hypothetical protein
MFIEYKSQPFVINMKAHEIVHCRGHPHIRGTHPSTFEVTKEEEISLQGDCIIGVGADKGAADLDPAFSHLLKNDQAILTTVLRIGTCETRACSHGNSGFTFAHPRDLVWRRSSYIDARTVGVASDRVAATLPRALIRLLQEEKELVVEMTVVIPGPTR